MHDVRSALMLLFVVAASACTREETIHSYRVPKSDVVYELNHVEGTKRPEKAAATRPERTLAAIVARADQGWFFKLTGAPEVVALQIEPFNQFVRSLRFDGVTPKWTLPASWKETPGSGMRFATLVIESGEKPLELSVISLPRGEESESAYLLANVNRWRGQLNLPHIAEAELNDELEKIDVTGAAVYVVDLEGTASDTGMGRPPFAGGLGPTPPAGPPARSLEGTQAAASAPATALTHISPEGWQALPVSGFRKAAFRVTEGDQKAEITVIDLEPAAGDLLANINRWRTQVGLSEQTQADLDKELKQVTVSNLPGQYVVLEGPGTAGKPQTILGVMVKRDARPWFIKLMGDAPLAAREKERFEAFVKSIKFGGGGSQ